jgi:hypothetical protein
VLPSHPTVHRGRGGCRVCARQRFFFQKRGGPGRGQRGTWRVRWKRSARSLAGGGVTKAVMAAGSADDAEGRRRPLPPPPARAGGTQVSQAVDRSLRRRPDPLFCSLLRPARAWRGCPVRRLLECAPHPPTHHHPPTKKKNNTHVCVRLVRVRRDHDGDGDAVLCCVCGLVACEREKYRKRRRSDRPGRVARRPRRRNPIRPKTKHSP